MSKNKYIVDKSSLDNESIISRISNVENSVKEEKMDRIKNDSILRLDIIDEKNEREKADSELSGKIDDLTQKISVEAVNRVEAVSEKVERVALTDYTEESSKKEEDDCLNCQG